MLDQNTDRMWYVIGAIVIGAAIIAMGLNIFSESFESVDDNFGSIMVKADTNIVRLNNVGNLITPDDLIVRNATLLDFDSDREVWSLRIKSGVDAYSNGLRVRSDTVFVPYGESLIISYEVFVPSDLIGVSAMDDVNNSFRGLPYQGSTDNDLIASRLFNGVNPISGGRRNISLEPGVWNKMSFGYVNSNISSNPNKLDLYDYSNFGVVNRTDDSFDIKIRNVKVQYGSGGLN